MSKKIIVAGAGHGGIAAAAELAKAGLDVTIYERNSEGKLGYDWTDIFAPAAWKAAGLEMPAKDKYTLKNNMTFFSSNQKKPLTQNMPENNREMKMERKDIYEHLITHALKCGVKFVYDCNISAPILFGNRVAGIKTDKGDFFGDLVIDAAGLDSPVRMNLPPVCGIEKAVGPKEQFFIYRAFYNRPPGEKQSKEFNVYFFPNGKLGMAWVANEEKYTDFILGRFEPFGVKEADKTSDYFRKSNPALGHDVLRGGQFSKIPVRHPIAVMVCDGYAAIGDSAFMTVPIIGSGIANSLKASKMLASTIIADKAGAYSAETLWDYQVDYYQKIGAGLAPTACIKILLTKLTPAELDYIFEMEILTAANFTIGSDKNNIGSMLSMSPAEIKHRLKAIGKDKEISKKVLETALQIGKTIAVTRQMPKEWNRKAVCDWSRRYRKIFL